MSAHAMPQDSSPASETITLTVEELQDLVFSHVVQCLEALGVEVAPEAITEAVAAQQGSNLARQPRGLQPEWPAPPDPDAPGVVTAFVLRPISEKGAEYRPGTRLYTTPERARRLADLGLVTLDASEAPPVPPAVPSPPAASALSMGSVPGMIRR